MTTMDKNRCCKKLNLPSEMMPDIDISQFDTDGYRWQDFYRLLRPRDFNNDKLFDFLKSYGIYSPPFLEVFYTPPFDDGRIHTDSSHEWVKLYFQFGAKGSTLRWWESDNVMNTIDTTEDVAVLPSTGNNYSYANAEDSTIIHEQDIHTPHLVNVGILHSSHNPTPEKRIAVTMHFFDVNNSHILWDDALSRLSKHLL